MKNRLVAVFILLTGLAKGQLVSKPIIIGTGFQSGLNIPVYKALGYLVEDDVFATDLTIGFPSSGKDYYEKLYNFPVTGLGFSATTLGNREVLGNAYAVYGFIRVPFSKSPQRFSLNLFASTGAAILPMKFDINENPLNRAIGSNYNIYLRLGIEASLRILPLADLSAGAGLSHFSNGKTRSPNYGINIGTFSLRLNCLFNHDQLIMEDPEIPVHDKKIIHSILASGGPKVYDNLYGYKYLSATLSYNLERYINNTGKAGVGFDLFYDGSIGEALSENGVRESDLLKLMRAGIHISYGLRYKRAVAGLQAGYYVYSKKTVLTSIYNKIFLQYMLSDNITGSVSIRSHWGKADALEYGLGYSW